jgi:ferrous iron transport protein B
MIIIKEQGMRIAAMMIAFNVPFAFLVGGLLNHTLRLFM